LHSGANAAREMNGKLSVRSAGLGRGATFTLEVPVVSEPDGAVPAGAGTGNGEGQAL
jgi:hypothetical protein